MVQPTGTGNFVAYAGTGTSMTFTGLDPLTNYEIDMYGLHHNDWWMLFAEQLSE